MTPLNFIPPSVRAGRQARRVLHGWVVIVVVAAGVLLPGALAVSRVGREALATMTTQRAQAEETARLSAQRLGQMLAVRTDLERRVAVLDAIAGHPDWSRLLVLLAEARGDDSVFEQIHLERRAGTPAPRGPEARPAGARNGQPAASAPPPAPPLVMALQLDGQSRSPSAVAGLVVRLEATGLFQAVRLAQTKPDARLGSEAVTFRIESILRGADPVPTPARVAARGAGVRTAAAQEPREP